MIQKLLRCDKCWYPDWFCLLSWKCTERQDLSIRNHFLRVAPCICHNSSTHSCGKGVLRVSSRDALVPCGLTVLSTEYKAECGIQVFQDVNMLKIFSALFFSKEKWVIFIAHSWAIVKEELNLFVPDFEILNLYKNIRSQTNFNASKAEFYEFTERWGKCDVPSWPLFHRKNDLVTKAEQEGLDWLCFPVCISPTFQDWF